MVSFTGFAVTLLLALVLAIAAFSPIVKAVVAKLLRRPQSSWSEGTIQVLVDAQDAKFEYETCHPEMTRRLTLSNSIVAVHGLGADAEYTWTRKVAAERVHLLRDLIAKDFPEARILNFAYNSDWLVDAPVKTAGDIANKLVEQLQRCRSGRRRLPILFIGHSFGGIVIKKALCKAGHDLKEMVDDTHGIIFLGTPHQGAAASTAGAIAASFLAGVLGSDTTLLLSLRSHQKQLSRLDERFGQCMREKEDGRKKTRLVCFSEAKPSWVFGMPLGIIVDRDSARCYDAEVVHVDVDHSSLNKCSGPDDRLYCMLRDKLEGLRPTASSIPSASQLYVSRKLDTVKNAVFGSHDDEHEGECLPGTRQNLLKEIDEWANHPARESIFWLQGMAGTGKSTIARTVARNSCLAASFFFKRGEGDRGKSRLFFTTIAAQLAQRLPVMADHLRNTLDIEPNISYKALGHQFDELILKPLKSIRRDSWNVTAVVIDALDECEGDQDVESIIYQLSRLGHLQVYPLKFFITSRYEPPIRLGFKRIDGEYVELPLHKIPAPEVEHDIAAFLRFRLEEQIRGRFRMSTDWPSRHQLQSLVEMAIPLFIFAATACRFIEDYKQKCGGADGRLEQILKYRGAGKLESTYLPILNQTIHGLDHDERDEALRNFKRIVGSIVTLANPLPANSLARLLDVSPESVEDELYLLHSVLDIPSDPKGAVKLFHESFRDFLNHSDQHDFGVDKSATHRMLAEKCLHILSKDGNLRKDMCDLRIAGTLREDVDRDKVDEDLPPEVQYACLYWAHHLKESDGELHDEHQVFGFLQIHLLHWLEAMSLMGRMTESIESITALQSLVGVDKGVQVAEFLYDAKRFVLNGRPAIEQAPLQVYASALVFAPERSLVRQRFKSHIAWITTKPQVEQSWNTCQQTLVHDIAVYSIAFSRDDRLVSASDCIRIWDLETGALHRTVDLGYGRFAVTAISYDGRLFVRGFRHPEIEESEEIEVWDTVKGALQWRLPSHRGGRCFAISTHDGGRLLGSLTELNEESLIRLWDLEEGTLLRTVKNKNSCGIVSLTFSVFNDRRVLHARKMIWDAEKGTLLRTLHGGQFVRPCNRAVAFCPHSDGRLLARGSNVNTVEIWDVVSEKLQRAFTIHDRGPTDEEEVLSLAFSGRGQQLASGSTAGMVKVWDAGTGQLLQTLEGHNHSVSLLAFSPYGQVLASSSWDGAVKVWDISSRPSDRQPTAQEAHDVSVISIALSADGGLVASGAEDGTMKIWDAASGAPSATFPACYNNSILWLNFSSDYRLVASVALRVRVWNSVTGALQQTMDELPYFGYGYIDRAVFSGDSRLLVGCKHYIILWNTTTGAVRWTTTQNRSDFWLTSLTFSSDDRLLASGSDDGMIMVWDVSTGALQWTLETNDHSFGNDHLLASHPHDDDIVVWDVTTGLLQLKAKQSKSKASICAIAFSSNNCLLASVICLEEDYTRIHPISQFITLRDARTGALQQSPESIPDLGQGCSVAFCEDGMHLSTGYGHIPVKLAHGDFHGCQQAVEQVTNLAVSRKAGYLGYSICSDKTWIDWNGRRALWIPPDYRPGRWAISRSTEMMAFAYGSGRVRTIGFSSAGPY
ncbi:hypothetical protein L249_6755 [Ophiocordyceps polyrhachis-furcata BCC 54312]|uniref:Uncharacterized protein n=1 Tax=Ophiocordyceps polyrhachis-furcata BCC 54312 TaxID=1330021 RepID=A0A367LLQ6_9HYPO|nr:hypothetical protein L249_6755 [Ophiocordyceps polyrhachis-furcata BCC 54312]